MTRVCAHCYRWYEHQNRAYYAHYISARFKIDEMLLRCSWEFRVQWTQLFSRDSKDMRIQYLVKCRRQSPKSLLRDRLQHLVNVTVDCFSWLTICVGTCKQHIHHGAGKLVLQLVLRQSGLVAVHGILQAPTSSAELSLIE